MHRITAGGLVCWLATGLYAQQPIRAHPGDGLEVSGFEGIVPGLPSLLELRGTVLARIIRPRLTAEAVVDSARGLAGERVGARLSTVRRKYDDVRCAALGLWLWAREHPRPDRIGMTDEQPRHRPKAAQPSGRQSFFPQALLLTPYRSLCICSGFAPSLRKKCLAANVIVFTPHST